MGGLDGLKFDNRFTQALPADPDTSNRIRQVAGACYSRVLPKAAPQPKLVAYSQEMAETFGLTAQDCTSEDFTQIFVGNRQLPGMDPYAMCYAGHQFGNWAGQLGDGRAINLGEVVDPAGQRWVLQLKGAGPTPYSRSADGLAVVRSSVREFLCSEAMHHLGVPTTRALSLITTGEQVQRDMFYNGNPKLEPGAVVCRVAPSFIRFGSFQIHYARGKTDLLRQLVHHCIRTDFPHLGDPDSQDTKALYLRWFEEVCRRTAEMVVHWQRVGFVHGVMNTDNMSILGLTIDYGPYGWLEDYDPNWTPNTTDAEGRRYRFGQQPPITQWNLLQLANAIQPLIGETEDLEQILKDYVLVYEQGWCDMMAQKLGLKAFDFDSDQALVTELESILQQVETDMTIFYRKLAWIDTGVEPLDDVSDDSLMAPLMDAYYVPDQLKDEYNVRLGHWLRSYIKRVREDGGADEVRRDRMNAVNPKYVLRNYLAQLAIDKAEQGDNSLVNELLELLRHPYDEQPDKEEFAQKRPDWARSRPGCSMLSCSS